MSDFDRSPDGLAFSNAVQAVQEKLGSRGLFSSAEWPIDISADLEAFITAQRSVFLATASADGQPYVQHRGGPPGFLKVLLVERLKPATGKTRAERALLIDVEAWDVNCAQYIPQRFEANDVVTGIAERDARIAALEKENAKLRHKLGK